IRQSVGEAVCRRKGNRQICCPNSCCTGRRNREREAVADGILLANTTFVRFLNVDGRGANPEQSEGSIAHFVEQGYVFNCRVVNAAAGANRRLARAAEELASKSFSS